MRFIISPEDFEEMLGAEAAVLFASFEWSARSSVMLQTLLMWEAEPEPPRDGTNFTVYQLDPDRHPFTWKWIGENVVDVEQTEDLAGNVLWLRKGSVVGSGYGGPKELTRLTKKFFDLDKGGHQNASLDAGLLEILCCPETHQDIRPAEPVLIERINQEIIAGKTRNRGGKQITEPIQGGLVRADQRYLYPIRTGIPIMLVDEAIPLVV
jgi:uncharacterized protein YbaR (Trm112 family)